MVKPGALFLLLAVAASQVDLFLSEEIVGTGEVDISTCPITFYGRQSSRLHVKFNADSSVAVCFKNYPSETARDCLVVENRASSDKTFVSLRTNNTNPLPSLPNINSTSNCYVNILFKAGSQLVFLLKLYNYGAQAAVGVESYPTYTLPNFVLNATVGESTLGSWTWTSSQTFSGVQKDISGCRASRVAVAAGSQKFSPEICSNITCSASAVITNVNSCGPLEVCQGNNTCGPPVVCTVTGSTVIDFFNRDHSVPDRCAYSLIKPQTGPDFNLVAVFRERRRKDVSFLDHLIIERGVAQEKMYLEQDGRVRAGRQTLLLETTAQMLYGVELSKDHIGVTAKMPLSGITVFFDGNTAHVRGPAVAFEGLCGNPNASSLNTTLRAEKFSALSAPGCEIQHNDNNDTSINCSHSVERCNLMNMAPFTACHSHIDPEAYVTACLSTLCEYPAVDGLKCQFLEAYAKSCSLISNVTLGDWRSMADCPAVPKAFCQGQSCSEHEFCGKKLVGTRCFCRAIFASKYKSTNTLGEPTVCTRNSATLTLARCLLEDKGIDYSALHLNDPTCKGHMDDETHMVTFSFDNSNTCGTEVTMNNKSQIVYKNTIMTRNSSMYSIITRHDQVQIDFSCLYAKPDIKSVSFRIKDSSVVQQIVSSVWNYTLMMNAYADPGRMNLIGPNTEVQLNQKIWLELKTEGLDGNMVAVVTDSCWATSQPSPDDRLRYNLIINGCPNPADQTVKVEGNGLKTSNVFSFNMFQFSGKNDEIYLHCKLELCPKQTKSCAPNCRGGARRTRSSSWSKYANEDSALITMAWSN